MESVGIVQASDSVRVILGLEARSTGDGGLSYGDIAGGRNVPLNGRGRG